MPASASAVNVRVGIGDQSPAMFADAELQGAEPQADALLHRVERELASPASWRRPTRSSPPPGARGVKILMHISTDDINVRHAERCRASRPTARSVGALDQALQAARRHGLGRLERGQPQARSRRARTRARAAQFFNEMRRLCTGCTIVALDVLDQAGVEKYIASFFKAAGANGARARGSSASTTTPRSTASSPRSASDRERQAYPGTRAHHRGGPQKANKRAKFWYTETGGLTKLGSAFPCDDARAADRTQYMFTLAKTLRHVHRSPVQLQLDAGAGLRAPALRRRPRRTPTARRAPAFNVFKSSLRNFQRCSTASLGARA